MDKLNISELLKDCPKGMELDCLLWDDVTFERVADGGIWIKYIDSKKDEHSLYVYNDGSFPIHNLGSLRTKCVIFPKGKTTWEGFQRPFKDGDIVTWDDRGSLVACIYKERKNTVSFNHHIALYKGGLGIVVNGEIALPVNELSFATEEEKQQLFDVIKANGYRWNSETKTLEKLIVPKFKVGDIVETKRNKLFDYKIIKITDTHYTLESIPEANTYDILICEDENWKLVPKKFDISKLQPFDKVLVRQSDTDYWKPAFWGRCITSKSYPFTTSFGHTTQAIPFKNNEWLVGTTEDCDNYYKTWM